MKVLFCYYSGTGNTKLACDYIVENIRAVKFSYHNIVRDGIVNFNDYDAIGFAAFADWLGPPQFFRDFIKALPNQSGKATFVFNTFGNFNGRTLKMMVDLVSRKGFCVKAAYALHTPENIPTMTTTPLANTQAPNPKELKGFNKFIQHLTVVFTDPRFITNPQKMYRLPISQYFMPTFPRKMGLDAMGIKNIDVALCNQCEVCIHDCPTKAIKIVEGKVLFDEEKCYACWACYNRCPKKAIYTRIYRGRGHYPKPIEALVGKLTVKSPL